MPEKYLLSAFKCAQQLQEFIGMKYIHVKEYLGQHLYYFDNSFITIQQSFTGKAQNNNCPLLFRIMHTSRINISKV